jgi:hypothetical protein
MIPIGWTLSHSKTDDRPMSIVGTSALSFNLKDLLTFGLALIGAVLGITNTWRAISRDKPKVKVIPKRAYPVGGIDERIDLCIEAVNLGAIAVTITELGVFHHGTAARTALITPFIIDGGALPRRLEPRTTVTVYGRSDLIKADKHPIRCAYATTDCGLTFTGTSPAFRALMEK